MAIQRFRSLHPGTLVSSAAPPDSLSMIRCSSFEREQLAMIDRRLAAIDSELSEINYRLIIIDLCLSSILN